MKHISFILGSVFLLFTAYHTINKDLSYAIFTAMATIIMFMFVVAGIVIEIVKEIIEDN